MKAAMTTFALAVLAVMVAAAPAFAGGGGGGGGHPCRGFASGERIVMRDSCFDGVGHVVEAGTTITVRNAGRMPHTFTAVDFSFDSGVLDAGETWELTVDEPGPVEVRCTLHSNTSGGGMAGLLTVVDDTAGGGDTSVGDVAAGPPVGGGSGAPLWLLAGGVIAAAGIIHGRRTTARMEAPAPSGTG